MDGNSLKWLCFSGTAVDYPAWSTKFTAFIETKGLYKKLLYKDIVPEESTPLAGDASPEQTTGREAKVRHRNKEIEDIKEQSNSVWCYSALTLDKTSLMYIRHDCLSQDGTEGFQRSCNDYCLFVRKWNFFIYSLMGRRYHNRSGT